MKPNEIDPKEREWEYDGTGIKIYKGTTRPYYDNTQLDLLIAGLTLAKKHMTTEQLRDPLYAEGYEIYLNLEPSSLDSNVIAELKKCGFHDDQDVFMYGPEYLLKD